MVRKVMKVLRNTTNRKLIRKANHFSPSQKKSLIALLKGQQKNIRDLRKVREQHAQKNMLKSQGGFVASLLAGLVPLLGSLIMKKVRK